MAVFLQDCLRCDERFETPCPAQWLCPKCAVDPAALKAEEQRKKNDNLAWANGFCMGLIAGVAGTIVVGLLLVGIRAIFQ